MRAHKKGPPCTNEEMLGQYRTPNAIAIIAAGLVHIAMPRFSGRSK
jgi:hypothetical protein